MRSSSPKMKISGGNRVSSTEEVGKKRGERESIGLVVDDMD